MQFERLIASPPRAGETFLFGEVDDEFVAFANAAIAILPVPYDGTSTYHKGADRGPEAIFEASRFLEH
ncbi:MAG: arginase family protein, partial [Bdellovibrionales bacterium]|nr:arginase family protein [Bdellovibrionales bacterium]